MHRSPGGLLNRLAHAPASIALVVVVVLVAGCRPSTPSKTELAAATYESLANKGNCAKKRWNSTIDKVYGEDEYIYGDEFPDAAGRLLPEAQRLADAFQDWADGLDDATWPSTVAREIHELADSLRTSSAGYALVAKSEDFGAYRTALGQLSTAIRPTASIRKQLRLPQMVGDGCPAAG